MTPHCQADPEANLAELPFEEAVRVAMHKLGCDEREARFVVGLERGEISGDTVLGDGPKPRT